MATPSPPDASERYEGFNLRSVTWGYRDIFEKAIEELFSEGCLGPHRQEVTSRFFTLLKRADQGSFDHVLRQFLAALNPGNRWLLDVPGLFADVTDVGGEMARQKLFAGIRFFETLARGELGGSPQELRDCLGWLRRLHAIDTDLAVAFLAGYGRLSRRLRPVEMERYLEVALRIFQASPAQGCAFLKGELSTSETYIQSITQECILRDLARTLQAMFHALAGRDCEMDDLGELDSDDLMERGSRMVAVEGHLYLPERVRTFKAAATNRHWYLLCGIVAAGMSLADAFPRIHGRPEYRTCAGLVGDAPSRVNLFMALEYARVLRRIHRDWPGARGLLRFGMAADMNDAPPGGPERLVAYAMDDAFRRPCLDAFRRAADKCVNCFDTAGCLDEAWTQEVIAAYPGIAEHYMRPIAFLPDFLFPVNFTAPPSDQLVAEMKEAARERRQEEARPAAARVLVPETGKDSASQEAQEATATQEAVFAYDEWDLQQNDYRREWCYVHLKPVEATGKNDTPEPWRSEVRKVRAAFERLKPSDPRRERRLADGDEINADMLLAHLIDLRREPSPAVRFYEKPFINRRDLATLILLDLSGSTGGRVGGAARTLDLEKQATAILGHGLAALADRFAIAGFRSSGREQCEYCVFKSFEDAWPGDAHGRLMAATAYGATRIGPALRHSGYLLSLQPARQRLLILVTDGQPTDQGYDACTRYAQHDVRMACEENLRRDVHTFAITTQENSLADMEIMFPRRRFAILQEIAMLPAVLPQLYLRLTF